MMNLGDEARSLIDLARDAHDPDERDRARVRAALASRLGAAAGLGLVAGLASAAKAGTAGGAAATANAFGAGVAAAKTLGTGLATAKLIGAAVLVSATLGLGATAVHRARHASVAAAAVTHKTGTVRQRKSPMVAKAAPPEVSAPTAEQDDGRANASSLATCPAVTVVVKTAPNATARTSAPGRSTRVAAETPSLQAGEGRAELPARRPALAVADEARLVHDGVVARRWGEPERALALFDTHALLHPQGVLAEERDAERALTLADLGRVEGARAAIERFLRMYPASPFVARLRERGRQLDLAHP